MQNEEGANAAVSAFRILPSPFVRLGRQAEGLPHALLLDEPGVAGPAVEDEGAGALGAIPGERGDVVAQQPRQHRQSEHEAGGQQPAAGSGKGVGSHTISG